MKTSVVPSPRTLVTTSQLGCLLLALVLGARAIPAASLPFGSVDAGPLTQAGTRILDGAWGDIDGDGRPDFYAATYDRRAGELFRNLTSGFERITTGSVRSDVRSRSGAAWGDYDNDGLPDLLVVGISGDADTLYHNLGSGAFAASSAGLPAGVGTGMSGIWADYDNDGRLDIFIARGGGAAAEQDRLYRNLGGGSFLRITSSAVTEEQANSHGAAFADIDGDGDLDLLVTHALSQTDSLFRNNGDGTFTRIARGEVGGSGPNSGGTLPIWGDIDNDGDLDLLILTGQGSNRLYLNDGSGQFTRVYSNPIASVGGDCAGGVFADFNNDGWLDLVLSRRSGHPLVFEGVGGGNFVQVTSGALPDWTQAANGVAVADVDGDGFLDVYLANWPGSGSPALFRNQSTGNNWLRIRPVGTFSNRSGIGAKVRIMTAAGGGALWQMRQIGGFDTAGSQELVAHFGLGTATGAQIVRVEWPSGIVQEIANVGAGQTVTVVESSPPPPPTAPVFTLQPVSQSVVEGGRVTFSSSATGTPPLAYRWYFGGAVVGNEAALTLSGVQSSQAGGYYVEVSNAAGTVRSDVAVLVVEASGAPKITSDPRSDSVPAGATVTFSVSAAGNPPLSYRWFWNGQAIPSATAPTLVLTGVQSAQAGTYTVEVRNGVGSVTSAPATLVVLAGLPPRIEAQPQPQSVELGGTAYFGVTATGVEPLSYRWWKNGAPVAGATSRLLTLARVTLADTGSYVADVSDVNGRTLTRVATLTVTSPSPIVAIRPGDLVNVDFGAAAVSAKTGPAAAGLAASDYWNTYARPVVAGEFMDTGSIPNLRRSDGVATALRLDLSNGPGAAGNGTADPMLEGYVQALNGGDVWVTLTELTPDRYDLYLYGHGGTSDAANSVFEVYAANGSEGVKATTTTAGWRESSWLEGQQYVVFRDVEVGNGRSLQVRVTRGGSTQGYLSGLQLRRRPLVPPAITAQPQSVQAELRGTATFTVTATGSLPLEYRWYRNDVLVLGGPNPTLKLVDLGPSSAGVYRVVVVNAVGSARSEPATLTVVPKLIPPSIVSQPVGRSVLVGEPVTLQVVAAGTEPLRYQWRWNGTVVPGATGASLVIAAAALGDTGDYSVEVENSAGKALSSVVRVVVSMPSIPPAITAPPEYLIVGVGEDAVFGVSATGSEPLSYAWFFNDSEIPGATGAELRLAAVTSTQQGSYRVEVRNGAGTVRSDRALLVVQGVVPTEGGSVQFVNRVTGSLDAPVLWLDGSTLLAGGTYVAQLYGGPDAERLEPIGSVAPFRTGLGAGYWDPGTDSARYVPSVKPGGSAVVQVRVWDLVFGSRYESAGAGGSPVGESILMTVATGGAGSPPTFPAMLSELVSFALRPASPPAIVTQPAAVTLSAGSELRLEVVATGLHLKYQWYRDDQLLVGATDAQFRIERVRREDQGKFRVVVSSPFGEQASAAVPVVVEWVREFRLATPDKVREGGRVMVPLQMLGRGEVGGGTLVITYDPEDFAEPQVQWSALVEGGVAQVNTAIPGEIRLVFARLGQAFPAGEQVLASASFRARSVPTDTTHRVGLELVDLSDATGHALTTGTVVAGTEVAVERRKRIGDNNANDRLDVGDATIILGYLTHDTTPRAWDVTGNDVNVSGTLDAGDAIKVLRVAVGLDAGSAAALAGPVRVAGGARLAGVLSAAEAPGAIGTLTLDPVLARRGGEVRVRVGLTGVGGLPSAVSFQVGYDPAVLRLKSAPDLRVGAMVPASALALWNVAPANDYANQTGQVRFVASSADRWPAAEGLLAELVFSVAPAAKFGTEATIRLEGLEMTGNGYDVRSADPLEAGFSVQRPEPARLGGLGRGGQGPWAFAIQGDPWGHHRVEVSEDLIHWEVVADLSGDADGFVEFNEAEAGSGSRFYRAVQVE